ncbi:MAG: hypothetical protein GY847_08675 [Proteobacteria bacterium]|nr:hypothetical protein [Pseudomonadota bacterium]
MQRIENEHLSLILVIILIVFGVSQVFAQEAEPGAEDPPPVEEPTSPEDEQPTQETEDAVDAKEPIEKKQPSNEQETDKSEALEDDQKTKKEEEKEPKKKEPFRRPFAGTSFFWNNEFTAISLDKSYEYTYNPVYSMSFGFKPVWAITDSISLSTKIDFSTELTNSDFSNKRGEVFFSDIPINGKYKYSININEDVKFGTGLNLGVQIPTSKLTRYATMYTALNLGTTAEFTFPKVLKGLTIGWKPGLTKYLHASENPMKEGNPLDESNIIEDERRDSQSSKEGSQSVASDRFIHDSRSSDHVLALRYGSGENPSWSVSNLLTIELELTKSTSFTFGYTHRYTYKYSATNTGDDIGGRYDPLGPDAIRDTGHDERGFYYQTFLYDLSYTLPKPVHMLTLSLGAMTSTNQLGPDGRYHTPFFNRETFIQFGLSLDIDATASALQDGKEKK